MASRALEPPTELSRTQDTMNRISTHNATAPNRAIGGSSVKVRTAWLSTFVALSASPALAQTPSSAPAQQPSAAAAQTPSTAPAQTPSAQSAAPAVPTIVAPAAAAPPAVVAQPGGELPGAVPPIGPLDVVPPPGPAEPATPQTPSFEPPSVEGAASDEPLDVPFEIQSLRDDQQGLQTDLENFKFQWQRERDLHTAITTRPLTINGVIQTRFGWTDQAVSSPTSGPRHTSFDIGSALIGFTGNLYKDYEEGRNLSYSLGYGASPQTNTNNSFLNLTNANITYSILPTIDRAEPTFTITLGQQLLPFGLEVAASEELKPVIRNAEFATQLQLSRRDIGIILRGDLFPQMDYGFNYRQALIAWAVGVLNGAGPNTNDDNEFKDVLGRLAFTVPSDYHSWLRQITIGGTVYWGKRNIFLADEAKTLSGTGIKQRFGVDVYYNHWPFGLTYEFIVGRDEVARGTSADDPQLDEVVSRAHTATIFLSFGEQFVAGFRNQGRYDDWWPKTYQPFVRFDTFDRDVDKDADEDRIDTITLGFNIFFAETTKFQVNLNRRDDETLPEVATELFGQLQFGF
jgi:Phosphate-selective porin O and P